MGIHILNITSPVDLYLLIKDCCKKLKKKRVEKQLKDDQVSDYRVC